MPRRADISIVLITERDVTRADFANARAPRLVELWRRERLVEGGIATAVELALGHGAKIARRVFVLTTAAWTQTVSLPATSVEGLAGDDLLQTLKFEVESFSGLAAFDSQLAQVEVDAGNAAEREFWIAQLSSGDLISIQEAVAARGGRLAGVCHPAGLPTSRNNDPSWKRLEFWPDVVCCIQIGSGRRLLLSHGDARSNRWQTALRNWEAAGESIATSEWLVGPGAVLAADQVGASVLRLDESADLERWLAGWARLAMRGDDNVPRLRPPRSPVARRTKVLWSVASLAVVLALCAGHRSFLDSAQRRMEQEIVRLRLPSDDHKQQMRQQEAIAKERQELETTALALETEWQTVEPQLALQRRRLATLLEALASRAGDEVVIRGMTNNELGVVLSGLSLVAEAATNLSDDLDDDLRSAGWRAHSPNQQGMNQLDNGGPWTFTIQLEEVAAPNRSTDNQPTAGEPATAESRRAMPRPADSARFTRPRFELAE